MTDDTGAGGGAGRPLPGDPAEETVVLHEEEASVDKRWEGVGYARFKREVDHERVEQEYPLRREGLVEERVPAAPDDSGKIETLPDGSISIPLFEEELIVTRRTVLRERVIVRKETAVEWQRVEAELRRERLEIDGRDAPDGAIDAAGLDDGAAA